MHASTAPLRPAGVIRSDAEGRPGSAPLVWPHERCIMIRGDGRTGLVECGPDPSSTGRLTLRSALKTGIVSMGYEGRDLETFIDVLVRHGVATLADVRLNAISRRAGFSKTKLSMSAAEAGMEYLHLRSLGNPRDNRDPFHRGRLKEGVARFKEVLAQEDAKIAIDSLVALARTGVVAVMCFESDHHQCHRDVVIDEIVSRTGASVTYL